MIDNDSSRNNEKQGEHHQHPGARPGNTNALKHGIYADRFLTPEEKPLFDAITTHLHKDSELFISTDFIQVELVAVFFLKLGRAQEAGDWDAAEKLDRMIRCHLRDLRNAKNAFPAKSGIAQTINTKGTHNGQ
ncbi:MAG: hypothetical protein ACYC64_19860 [Armatimonadota bacterium]